MLSATVLGAGGFVQPAHARTILASAGRAVEPGDYACFRLSGSSMINFCTTVKRLELPLAIDVTGTFRVKINVTPPNPSSPISCQAIAVNENNTAAWYSGSVSTTTPGNLFMSVTVPVAGALFANCDVPQSGYVNTITW
jgi:hypothetical protein